MFNRKMFIWTVLIIFGLLLWTGPVWMLQFNPSEAIQILFALIMTTGVFAVTAGIIKTVEHITEYQLRG